MFSPIRVATSMRLPDARAVASRSATEGIAARAAPAPMATTTASAAAAGAATLIRLRKICARFRRLAARDATTPGAFVEWMQVARRGTRLRLDLRLARRPAAPRYIDH